MFRHVYVLDNGEKRDILKNGELSCAYYVSCILKLFNLISDLHTTVDGAIKDMLNSDWGLTEKLVPGNILVWEDKKSSNGEIHSHLGFYLGEDKAISNSKGKGTPIIHHFTYNQERKIIKILTHKIIE